MNDDGTLSGWAAEGSFWFCASSSPNNSRQSQKQPHPLCSADPLSQLHSETHGRKLYFDTHLFFQAHFFSQQLYEPSAIIYNISHTTTYKNKSNQTYIWHYFFFFERLRKLTNLCPKWSNREAEAMENKQTILEMIINTQIPRKMFFATIDAGRNKQSNNKKKKKQEIWWFP